MSKKAKREKQLKRVAAKRTAKAARMVHKEKISGLKTANRIKKGNRVREANRGNLGDYKVHFEFNAPFLARTLLAEYAGYKNQYTSKCPRHRVRQWILKNYRNGEIDPVLYKKVANNQKIWRRRQAA